MNKMMVSLSAVAATAVFCATAQDMGETTELLQEEAPAVAEAAEAVVDAPLSIEEIVTRDDGVVIAEEAQKTAPAEFSVDKDANTAMVNWLKGKYVEGFCEERGYFLQIGVARDRSIDPQDEDFMTKREMLYREAQLRAKVEISGLVDREVTGRNWKKGLSVQDVKAFEAKYAREINAMNEMKRKVAKLMVALDTAETEVLKGVTTTDRLNAFVDKVIKKLDQSYDAGQIAAEKKARYEEIKSKYEEAKAAADELEAMKNDMFPSQTVGASIDSAVRVKLHGAMPIHQLESYDGKEFQVAVAVIWSPKLEERASSILARREVAKGKPTEDRTLQEYLSANEDSLPVMVGSRQFVDKDGRLYFIGISAQEIPDDVIEKDENILFANQMAMQAVVMSLFVEGKGVTAAAASLAKRKGRDGDPLKSLAENMEESTPENMSVSGLGKVYSHESIHPITKKPIYISVAAVDAALAAKSPVIKNNWDVRASDTVRTLNAISGARQGAEDAYQDAKNSRTEYEAARRSVRDGINAEVKAMRGEVEKKPAPAVKTPPAPINKTPGKAEQGVFGGNAGYSDDF